jgi:hypothetical protein
VYSRTTTTDPTPRIEALSRDVKALIKERRAQDPRLGVPDALAALELVKASLLEESGFPLAGRRAVLLAMALLLAVTAAMTLLLLRR